MPNWRLAACGSFSNIRIYPSDSHPRYNRAYQHRVCRRCAAWHPRAQVSDRGADEDHCLSGGADAATHGGDRVAEGEAGLIATITNIDIRDVPRIILAELLNIRPVFFLEIHHTSFFFFLISSDRQTSHLSLLSPRYVRYLETYFARFCRWWKRCFLGGNTLGSWQAGE